MRISIICDYCGKEATATIQHHKRNKLNYCNRECYYKYKKQKNTSIKFNCEQCGKEKTNPLAQYKQGKHHFCSKECYDKFKKGKPGHKHTKKSKIKMSMRQKGKKRSAELINRDGIPAKELKENVSNS